MFMQTQRIKQSSILLKCTITLLCLLFLMLGCGGTKPIKKVPKTIQLGQKELKRGSILYYRGCYTKALKNFYKAHEFFVASDNLNGIALSLNNIGNMYKNLGDAEKAIIFFQESAEVYSDIKKYRGTLQALSNMITVHIDTQEFEKANKALNLAETLAKKNNISSIPLLNTRGLLLLINKKYGEAEKLLKKTLFKISPKNGLAYAEVNYLLGRLKLEIGHYSKAVRYLNKALEADKKKAFQKGIANDLVLLAKTFVHLEKYQSAVTCLKRSIKIFAISGSENKVNSVMELLNQTSKKAGIDISATKYFVENWLKGDIVGKPCY